MSEGYNSFYGGRRGASFVIVKKYKTITEMINCFQQGGSYKTVNYDEYVLIDTESKNDVDNGKIYRRGYDYTNSMGGAEFVGQIVGPAGMAPHTELTTINEVLSIGERDDFSYRRGQGSYNPDVNLIPGKYYDNTSDTWKFNDEIQWAYCSVRDINSHESTVHVGFKFPYIVLEIEGSSVNPYYNRSNDGENFINENLITRTDDKTHPFFESWNIAIPKGIKGDALKNLKVVTANGSIKDYAGKSDDILNNRQVIVYEQYNYDSNENGVSEILYVGDYNMVSNVLLEDDGTLKISYTHNNNSIWNKKIKWITQTTIDTTTGELIIDYNTGDNDTHQLIYPRSISVNTGSIEGEGNQKLKVTYTDGTTEDIGNPINYIMSMACDSSTGYHLYVLYADPARRGDISYNGRNDWIDLGYMGNGDVGCIAAKADDPGAAVLAADLPSYSVWLIIEEKEENLSI